nr:MAG TPA: hypothetical protein [Caudoviricetes sp.]
MSLAITVRRLRKIWAPGTISRGLSKTLVVDLRCRTLGYDFGFIPGGLIFSFYTPIQNLVLSRAFLFLVLIP